MYDRIYCTILVITPLEHFYNIGKCEEASNITNKVTELKEFRKKKKLVNNRATNNINAEMNITVDEESLFKELRAEKRKERGISWD